MFHSIVLRIKWGHVGESVNNKPPDKKKVFLWSTEKLSTKEINILIRPQSNTYLITNF